jgi:hypothetical protein
MSASKDVRDYLLGNGALIALVASYDAGPAVFDGRFPGGIKIGADPALIIDVPRRVEPDNDFSVRGRSLHLNIRLYRRIDNSDPGPGNVDAAADLITDLFDARSFDIGPTHYQSTVAGPVDAPTDDKSLIGRLIQLSLIY